MVDNRRGTGFSLKDQLFNRNRVQYLAGLFHAADENFNASGFVRDTMKQLKKLELKERIVHIAVTLESHLATDYRVAARQIADALPPPLDPTKTDDDFGDFIFAPLGEYIVRNGLAKKHLKLSLKTLKALTQRASMEDAIRTFINTHTDGTLGELKKWSTDKNYHIRRLVSEGTRPLLPWSRRLSIDTATAIPLLDTLHADPTRYVTRSVSNHLNDIAKTHPQQVLSALKRWKQEGAQEASELQWMSRHALRTLVKQGNPQALMFLGFKPNPQIRISKFALISSAIRPGQAIEFSFTVAALRDEPLLVDYVIDFVKANGTLSPRVHKLKQIRLKKNESATIAKRHVLRANATTYTLYPGTHHVTLQINGKSFGSQSFELL
jgi:3-methyladenine DNA glycosylase AlkC